MVCSLIKHCFFKTKGQTNIYSRYYTTDSLEEAIQSLAYIGEVNLNVKENIKRMRLVMGLHPLREFTMFYYGRRNRRLSIMFGYEDN